MVEDNQRHQQHQQQGCEEELELYADSVMHLTLEHRDFFFKWYKMLELEFSDLKQFDSGDDVWWKSRVELENLGYSVFDLRLVAKPELLNGDGSKEPASIDGNCLFDFVRDR